MLPRHRILRRVVVMIYRIAYHLLYYRIRKVDFEYRLDDGKYSGGKMI